ncbi:MAG: GH1 family beta-glucosidase [Fimbriimonadaceae bacterium]|nr:GH1 family beta-glucosidase [Fimbriimonadaceae bacterium]
MGFRDGFAWGVATASYQIEGAPYRVGGGRSVWDMFCERPGAINDGSNGDVACDHYHRYREDVALMQQLGVPNYRLSISWPRVIPGGVGSASPEGLGFYDRLVDELLTAGIQPWVTLYHWDTPYELYLRGGWLNRDIVEWFADYTQVVVDRLGDRVQHWMTLNEPQCFIGLGMQTALHAPGDRLNFKEVLLAGHHALMAHGRAVQVIRARAARPATIGYAPVGVVKMPATPDAADIEAARTATFRTHDKSVWSNAWWNDPVFFGHYPEAELAVYGSDAPTPRAGDLELIAQPLDFFGANIYNGQSIRAGEHGPTEVPHPQGIGRTVYHWPVTPDSLYWGPKFFYERYGKPVVITENGLGLSDWVALDGKVHDPQRIDFLHRYIAAFRRAAEDGVDAMGYFQWSFMDNFEWYEGYKLRFGLVHVDYQTQVRTPKDSAYWYRDVMRSNAADL